MAVGLDELGDDVGEPSSWLLPGDADGDGTLHPPRRTSAARAVRAS
jgi:hypothetical protein